MLNLYFVTTFVVVYINLFILVPLHLGYKTNNSDGVDTDKNNVVLKHLAVFNKTKKSSLNIHLNTNIKISRDSSDVWDVHRIVKREDDNGDDDDDDEKDDDDDEEDEKDSNGEDEKDDKEEGDDDEDDEDNDSDKKPKSNVTANVNDTSDSFDADENLPTTTKVYVYPYTDDAIDIVADNGLKYTSTSSDQMRENNETSDTSENFARITDDSEPLHFLISGASDLSQDSEQDVGIENLLPDYVRPTIPGQEEEEQKTEKVNEEDEVVLSEEIETTTTEITTRYQNSYEFHGEGYESSEEENKENMTLTTTPNNTDISDDIEYKDYDTISTTLLDNITGTTSENIATANETTTEITITEITTPEPITEEILFDTTSTTTTVFSTTKKKKLSTIDTVESEEIKNMTGTFSTDEEAKDYDPFGENNFSVFHPYSKESINENVNDDSSYESVEMYTVLDDLEEFTTPHYLNLHLKPTNKAKPLLLLKKIKTDLSNNDISYKDDSSEALATPGGYINTTVTIIANETGSSTTEAVYVNDSTTNIYKLNNITT